MRTVALVGFASNTRHLAYDLPGHIEMWTLNRGWHFADKFTRIDRLFEMHDLAYLQDPNNSDTRETRRIGDKAHWDWLQERHDYPLYCLDAYSEIPNAIRYPLESVSLDVYRHIWRGGERLELFTSSFDYMLALSIYEGYNRVLVFGFEMATGTEYSYQRDAMLLLVGTANGRGIDVVIPEQSGLIPRMKLYGYEGAQMISRQTLDAYKRQAEQEKERYKALANARIGVLQYIQSNGGQGLADAQRDHMEALRMLDKWDGVNQVLELLIAECDMLEVTPEILQNIPIVNAFEGVKDNG